ncbi:winged helix-turn-helix transcriptional regulator [Haloarcula sp. Atlit-7R]|uniref:winged helix-turn-helix transcriptional regulator n=1 Tax=Haloarcula sp. Atlit-7R TaxID=2282125 RepID=UPI000EF175B5|nr:winged helix-turn-helix transcriptional regulator [Haloarcula sp. Atlit-7R]RLM94295.1 winged helix-turn-helix domain-containing protein [Haloarcula sp. Atlit-7R]
MVQFEIDDLMDEILDLFQEEGNLTTGALIDMTGTSRQTVKKRLDKLHAAECIVHVHSPTALYRLVDDPREDSEASPQSPSSSDTEGVPEDE